MSGALAVATCASLPGCSAGPSPVWVDVAAVQKVYPPDSYASVALPKPPAPTPAKTISFQGSRAETIQDPFSSGKVNASEAFVRSRKIAERALLRRLAEYYQNLADSKSRALLAKLGDPYAQVAAGLYPQVRARFERWANDRSPLLLKLALVIGKIVGPDQVPKPPPPVSPLVQARYDAIVKTAEALQRLDAAYNADIAALISKAIRRARSEQLIAIEQVVQFEQSLREEAQKEAASQLGKPPQDLGLSLASPHPFRLAPLPGKALSLPPGAKIPNPPKVDSSMNFEEINRQAILHDLRIWLAIRGYRLAGNPAGVPNKTEEFIKWRKGLTVGR